MGGWLAGLDAFVVGLAYLVALLAARFVVRPLLLAVFGSAPVFGGWLSGRIDGFMGDFERAITPAANASMGTLITALDWLTDQAKAVLGGIGDLAEEVEAGFYRLGQLNLPQVIRVTLTYVEGLIADARGFSLGLFQQAEADANLLLSQAETAGVVAVSAAEANLRGEISAAESVVLQEIRKAEQATGQLFQQAEYDAGQLVAASESKLADLVASARADLGAAVGAVEHDLQLLAQAERVALEDSASVLGGDIQAAEARAKAALSALDESTKASIEGILSGLPWQSLAAAVGAGEAMLQADVRTLIGLGAQEIRKAIGDAEAIRAKYGPQVRAALSELKV